MFRWLKTCITYLGGAPNPNTVPVKLVEFTLSDDRKISWTQSEVTQAFDYGLTSGLPQLVMHCKYFARLLHGQVESKAWDVVVTRSVCVFIGFVYYICGCQW